MLQHQSLLNEGEDVALSHPLLPRTGHGTNSCTLSEACQLTSTSYVYACVAARACGSAFSGVRKTPRRVARAFWGNGLACSLLSTTVFSFSSLCVKMTGGRIPVLQVTATRSVISFLISLLLASTQGIQPLYGQSKHLRWLLVRGVFGALAMTTYYVSIFSLPLADAVTIGLIQPPLTAFAAWLVLGEVFGWRGMGGCLACVAGVVIVAHPPFLFGGAEGWGMLRAVGVSMDVLSCLLGAVAVTSIRLIGRAEHAITVAMWFHTCTIIMCTLPLALGWPQAPVLPLAGDMLLLLGVALTSFAGQLLMTRGLQLIPAAQASTTSFAQVIYSNLWGYLFFGEPLTAASTAGAALIVTGVLVVTAGGRGSRQQPDDRPRPELERTQSLLHKLLHKCPRCGTSATDEEEALAGQRVGTGTVAEQKLGMLAAGFGMTHQQSGTVPLLVPLRRATSETQQLLSDAAAGGEACTGRSPPVHDHGAACCTSASCGPLGCQGGRCAAGPSSYLFCRTCSCGMILEEHDRGGSGTSSDALLSARSSFVTCSSVGGASRSASVQSMPDYLGPGLGGSQQRAVHDESAW